MKAEDILTELYENFQDGKSWDEALKKIEEYSNQRVIEELETIEDIINSGNSGLSVEQRLLEVLNVIKQLKQ